MNMKNHTLSSIALHLMFVKNNIKKRIQYSILYIHGYVVLTYYSYVRLFNLRVK